MKRREFLKTSAKAGAVTAVAGVAFSACSSGKPTQEGLTRGKSKKVEVLYQKSKYWDAYYKVAY
ncbi:hypothetical protein CCY99_08695 [Helicobacter sp. 16-1353]|uniref:twin-arginine translocation signal domain-containing protein n=1 Tax=Helicobacter sp. 16-1353 TaxID=2004996 RepID=UPI000DCB91C4|nr:twin-arginine translocation signal domain-containing protein [Helicobacter sp. 16-1353]RAX51631.1 hypothetical protein CCY99_08695 [Helicobacter sp. 16-1353]